MPRPPQCKVVRLGLVEYEPVWHLQMELAQQVAQGLQPNTLLLVEHHPVYTIGRRGNRQQVLLNDQELEAKDIALLDVDRGGEVTFHGPGQLVAYPIVDLRSWGGPLKYVRTLEQVIIKALADFGILPQLVNGLTGVWVGQEKIASIGLKISRGIAYHGFALNVNTDLSLFNHIIPCGSDNRTVTSIEKTLSERVDIETVAYSLMYHFGREMGFRMEEVEGLPPTVERLLMASLSH